MNDDMHDIIIYTNLNSCVWLVLVSQVADVTASKSVSLSEPFRKNVSTSAIIMFPYIVQCLQHTGLRGSIDPLLEEADIDKDGKISLSEFRRLLRTASMGSRNLPSPSGQRSTRKL